MGALYFVQYALYSSSFDSFVYNVIFNPFKLHNSLNVFINSYPCYRFSTNNVEVEQNVGLCFFFMLL